MTQAKDECENEAEIEGTVRIDHDDQPEDIVRKINRVLSARGLEFVDDGEAHDGFCLYTLVENRWP